LARFSPESAALTVLAFDGLADFADPAVFAFDDLADFAVLSGFADFSTLAALAFRFACSL
jgi:hypothetical protein